MSFFDANFDEIFENFGLFNSKSMKKIQEEIDAMLKEVDSDELKGTWKTKEINEPGMKGWIFIRSFGSDEALEPFDPLKPQKKRPVPERPFDLSKNKREETREPLTDVFEEEKATKIYLELPGEEKEDIQLKANEGSLEVKAKNFYKKIDLPNDNVSTEEMTSDYRNGVLTITLPKKISLRKEDSAREKTV
jgi:HSP20 family molecular chaperone IbpA